MTQLVHDNNCGILYCLWHGNDDYTDCSQDGFFNGEIYGAFSTDEGLTWSEYVNLTNTRSPGAGPGACFDEDYLTANPYTVNDSIWTTYIEDKDAGAFPQMEGALTENPVRCWVFSKRLITGVEEHQERLPTALSLHVAPNPFTTQTNIAYCVGRNAYGEKIKIYDTSGRMVKSITQLPSYPITWQGDDQHGAPVPAGVYFLTLTAGDESTTRKVVKLE
jgi:hypothetical protein